MSVRKAMNGIARMICALLALAAASANQLAVAAEAYPTGPIKLIIPFAAGGVGDIVGRSLGEKVGKELGQPVVIDNRAGGNSVIGTYAAARAKPDGYTILQMTGANVIVTALQKVPYDLQRDFTTVIGVGSAPLALAVPAQLNINSLDDLVAYAKSNPNGLIYASGGVGSLGHLSAARLVRALNIKALHVPYRGNSGAVEGLLGGQTQMFFGAVLDSIELAKAGKLKILAVTSDKRMPNLPDVPTMKELGFQDFTPTIWYGYNVPANTPQEIVDRLAAAFAKGASQPDLQARLADLGVTINLSSGPEFAKYMREELARWQKVASENNIKLEE
jgi:tripartite-type tricarboxylate transporter receptor subunit TctC